MLDRPTSSPALHRVAVAVSEVFAPAVLVSLFLVLVSTTSAPWPQSALFALVSVGFTTALPLGWVLALVRRGLLTDHHISRREQRAPVLAAAVVSIVVGILVLGLVGAPEAILVAVVSTIAGVVMVLAVNLWWKLSAHSAVAVFVTIGGILVTGPAAVPLALVPAAVGWSRVHLRAHTPLQVLAGYGVGAVIGAFYALLSPS